MKKYVVIGVVLTLIAGGAWWWFSSKNNTNNLEQGTNNSNYQAQRSGTTTSNKDDFKNEGSAEKKDDKTPDINGKDDNISNNSTTNKPGKEALSKKETEIANFSTKIYNKDEERQNNITITCQRLTNCEIAPGETFSFEKVVGKATTDKGYEKADIYVEGKKEQGLGGGNCQVSTTLYNAVLKVPELEVVERHKHSGHVPYIQDGNDAAVSYGAYDFKFKNNTSNTIKIVMENSPTNVTAKLIKIG